MEGSEQGGGDESLRESENKESVAGAMAEGERQGLMTPRSVYVIFCPVAFLWCVLLVVYRVSWSM